MEENQSSQNGLIAAIVFAAVIISGSLGFLGYQMYGGQTIATGDEVDTNELMAMLQDVDKNVLANIMEDINSSVNASYEALVDDDAFMGDENAPVTIVEFSDYQCPFCQRHFKQTLPQIKKDYIDTGKVKYVFRDFPLSFHTDAKKAATAADCAREQGNDDTYFQMNNKIYSGTTSSLSDATLIGYATDIDLDVADFKVCLSSGKYDAEVDADMAAGSSFGVTGTPGFIITDGESSKLVSGAQPFAAFKSEIDKRLN